MPRTHQPLVRESRSKRWPGFGAIRTTSGPLLPLTDLDVRTTFAGLDARTTVRQRFCNPLDEFAEATYIFPLPDRAAVTHFELRVGERIVKGTLKERGQAREEYTEALETGHRAALAEEERPGVFTIQVGNLPPGEAVIVELSLVGPLEVVDGEATFRFPLVVAERYISGLAITGPSVGQGIKTDTYDAPDASRISPPVLLPGFRNPVRLSIEVELDEMMDPARCASSLHHTLIEHNTLRILPGERLDRDFILRMPVVSDAPRPVLRVDPQTQTFSLTLFPPALEAPPRARSVVLLLDRSGSMRGWSMVAARRAVGRMIDSLQDDDTFNVIAFDDSIESFRRTPVPANNQARWEALEWLSNIHARGGTEMQTGIKAALGQLRGAVLDPVLVLITDGQIGAEDHCLRMVAKHRGEAIIHTVGIDEAVNAGFLRRLAKEGRGTCELVESQGRLDEALDRIMRQIGTPILSGLQLHGKGTESLTPSVIPDLYPNRPVVIYGRGNPSELRMDGFAGEQRWSALGTCEAAREGVLLPAWGRSRVRDLEDQYAIKPKRKLEREIVTTSLQTGVLCRFTAFLAVDEAEVVNPGGMMERMTQAVQTLEHEVASLCCHEELSLSDIDTRLRRPAAAPAAGSAPKTVKLKKHYSSSRKKASRRTTRLERPAKQNESKTRSLREKFFGGKNADAEKRTLPTGGIPKNPPANGWQPPEDVQESLSDSDPIFKSSTLPSSERLAAWSDASDPKITFADTIDTSGCGDESWLAENFILDTILAALSKGAAEIYVVLDGPAPSVFLLIGDQREAIQLPMIASRDELKAPSEQFGDTLAAVLKLHARIDGPDASEGVLHMKRNDEPLEIQVSVAPTQTGECMILRLPE